MGLGIATDILQASKWYQKAAEQGDVVAQSKLDQLSAVITKEKSRENTEAEETRKEAGKRAPTEGL
jgi:TPR repeat protein